MKKDDLVGQKPDIEKLIEQMEKNLERRIIEEKNKPQDTKNTLDSLVPTQTQFP